MVPCTAAHLAHFFMSLSDVGVYHVSKVVNIVKAGVAAWRNDIPKVIGRQTEVGNSLIQAISVFDVHTVVLQGIQGA